MDFEAKVQELARVICEGDHINYKGPVPCPKHKVLARDFKEQFASYLSGAWTAGFKAGKKTGREEVLGVVREATTEHQHLTEFGC